MRSKEGGIKMFGYVFAAVFAFFFFMVGLFLTGFGAFHLFGGVGSGTVWGITIELSPAQKAARIRYLIVTIIGVILSCRLSIPAFLVFIGSLIDFNFLVTLLTIAGFFAALGGGMWVANRQMLSSNDSNAIALGRLPFIQAVEAQLPQAKAFVINRDGIGLYNENDYCFTAFNYEDYGLGRLSSVRQLALVGLYFSQTHKDFSCKTDFDRFYTPGHSVTYYGLGGVHVGHTSGTYSSRLNSYVFYRNSPELTA